ncbi:MAG: rod shape-determining protein MreC, partial [Verrucomicrobiota bacterium]|nr:rod shape-determining protein MreC [Verrucomicrobiota bacterium]
PENPLQLMSSDLGGSLPEGIPIGIVENLTGGEDGLFKSGNVILDSKLIQVQEVTILVPR